MTLGTRRLALHAPHDFYACMYFQYAYTHRVGTKITVLKALSVRECTCEPKQSRRELEWSATVELARNRARGSQEAREGLMSGRIRTD